MKINHTLLALVLTISVAAPQTAAAQLEAHGARNIGLGGASPASVVGQTAINLNPARLTGTNAGFRQFSMTVGGATVFAGGPLVQFKSYNEAFTTGAAVSQEEGQAIINDWFGGSDLTTIKRVGVQAETIPIAFAIRTEKWGFGASLRTRTYGQVGVNGGWVDLLLVGTGEERTIPLNADMSMASTADISVGVARAFMEGRLSVGVTPRIVFGSDYSRIELDSDATISSTSVIHDFNYKIQSAGSVNRDVLSHVNLFRSDAFGGSEFRPNPIDNNGTGFGADVGVRFAYSNNIEFAASVTDIGSIEWKGDASTYAPVNNQFRFDGLEINLQELKDDYDNDFGDYLSSKVDSLARIAYEETTTVDGSFRTSLPTRIHVGSAWHFGKGKGLLSAGGSVAANTAPGNVSRNPSMHVGSEYKLGSARFNVPVRGGVQIGGSGAITLAFGFGVHLGPYRMDIGVAATPSTTSAGQGGRYLIGASLMNLTF